jgi:hypothetical protein
MRCFSCARCRGPTQNPGFFLGEAGEKLAWKESLRPYRILLEASQHSLFGCTVGRTKFYVPGLDDQLAREDSQQRGRKTALVLKSKSVWPAASPGSFTKLILRDVATHSPVSSHSMVFPNSRLIVNKISAPISTLPCSTLDK